MATRDVKIIFLGLGFLLTFFGYAAFYYKFPSVGMYGSGYSYPLREYAWPIGIVGVIVLIIGLFLSREDVMSFVKGLRVA